MQNGNFELLVWGIPMYSGLIPNLYDMFFQPVFGRPQGSILHLLYKNLFENGLHENVTIVGGSQNYPKMEYHIVWSDAAHDMTEIKRNEPVWLGIWNRSTTSMVFVFHDLGIRDEFQGNLRTYIRTILKPSFEFIIGMTYAIEVHKA